MNIVFGNQVGNFNQYFTPGSSLNEETFKASVNRNRLVGLSGNIRGSINLN